MIDSSFKVRMSHTLAQVDIVPLKQTSAPHDVNDTKFLLKKTRKTIYRSFFLLEKTRSFL